jgi:ParB family chromosome partitioning protein
MAMQKGLGRGLEALIPTQIVEEEFDPTAAVETSQGVRVSRDEVRQVNPNTIVPNPHQPRTFFDETALEELSLSIKEHGILQPLVVTQKGDGYELIAGERRLRASKLAKLATVPVIIRSFSEQQKLELALIENLQRENLNPIETATSYRKLIDQFNLTNEQVAKRVGKSPSAVSNTMRLLNLPLEVKRAVATGKISEGHARAILMVQGGEKQLGMLEMILSQGLTVRQAENLSRDFKQAKATKQKSLAKVADTNDLTSTLSDYLGAKVSIQRTAKGGKLMIEYYSDEELDRIYQAIKGE